MASGRLTAGKLKPDELKDFVFKSLGVKDQRVLLGPQIGEDASIIDFGRKALVVHSDPITGAVENVGWLSVNICANDIATRGIRARWMIMVLLLPENMSFAELKHLTRQIDQATKRIGIAVVGGHTEVTMGINRPIIIATAMGEALKECVLRTSGIQPGDYIIVTKGAAIEGTAILANELCSYLKNKMDKGILEKAKQFFRMTSIVKDALTAVEVGGVNAMHDATEGGIAGCIQEMAWASKVGMVIYEKDIPVYPETEAICRILGIEPLRTISSGALLISAQPEKAQGIISALRKRRIQSSIIGRALDKRDGRYIIKKDGTRLDLEKPVEEELWKVLKKLSTLQRNSN